MPNVDAFLDAIITPIVITVFTSTYGTFSCTHTPIVYEPNLSAYPSGSQPTGHDPNLVFCLGHEPIS